MEFFVDLGQMFVGDVGIDLRGGDVGMAQECLDGAEVGSVL